MSRKGFLDLVRLCRIQVLKSHWTKSSVNSSKAVNLLAFPGVLGSAEDGFTSVSTFFLIIYSARVS